jgi:hypothetical protein
LLEDPSVVNGDATVLPPAEFGYPRGQGHWASCISIIDPVTEKKVLSTVDLEENEAAVSIATVSFASQADEVFLVVGTGKDMMVSPDHRQPDSFTSIDSMMMERRSNLFTRPRLKSLRWLSSVSKEDC